MRNLMWQVTAVALDVPLLMLSLLVEWRIRVRASGWRGAPGLPALPSGGVAHRE